MRRKINQNTYSQTTSQYIKKPNLVYIYGSYQKEQASSDVKINPNQTGNRTNTYSNVQVNPFTHRNFDLRQYQQNLKKININSGKTNIIQKNQYHQQNNTNNNRDRNKYIRNVQKKDFDLSISEEMNKTVQYNNLSYYYSPNFKKNTDDAIKNKSGNITNISEISKKILPSNGDNSQKNGSENNSIFSYALSNVHNNSYEKRNIRENIYKQEPQKNGESLFNKMDNLIKEIRTEIKEMKDGRIQMDSLIEEMKNERIASQNQMDSLIEEMRSSRIASQNQMNSLIEEMRSSRIASQNQMNSLIGEMKKDRNLSKKQHEELMGKFDLIFGKP